MNLTSAPAAAPDTDGLAAQGTPDAANRSTRVDQIPREVGILLMAAGAFTGMKPPPPGPFDVSLMLAGGVTLWPRGLNTIEAWARKRFPLAHSAGMAFLGRYLDDLERRYPGSTVREKNTAGHAVPPPARSLVPEVTDEATDRV